MKKVKYNDRFKKRVCPICGCNHFFYYDHHITYPEVWITLHCKNCNCVTGYADNCLWQDLWEYLSEISVRSKKKVIKAIREFYPSNEHIGKIIGIDLGDNKGDYSAEATFEDEKLIDYNVWH